MQWTEFAEFTAEIDGTASFELPATEYISSGRGPDGTGNVSLEVTVQEKATGHVETTTAPHTVVHSTVNLQLIPEGSSFKPSLPFSVLLVTDSPDRSLIDHDVGLETYYFDEGLSITYSEESRVNTVDGKALVSITPPEGTVAIAISWRMPAEATRPPCSRPAHSPSNSFIHLEQVRRYPRSWRSSAIQGPLDRTERQLLLRGGLAGQGGVVGRISISRYRFYRFSGDGWHVEAGRVPDVANRGGGR